MPHTSCMFRRIVAVLAVGILVGFAAPAAAEPGDFSLQVTPTPLTATVKPGETTSLEFKIRNTGSQAETLSISPRNFTFNSVTQQVELDDTTTPAIAQWIHFSAPTFTVQAGQWFTQKIDIAVPKDAGFSYSFALLLRRANEPAAQSAGQSIKGSVMTFGLLNVDRPGATRQLEITDFKPFQQMYEHLPAILKLRIKNTGNTIVQPAGNVFIQRGPRSDTPISILRVNELANYILPGSERDLTITWSDNKTSFLDSLANARMGHFTAKAVVVYNDGQRDTAAEKETTFWLFPWRLIGAGLLFVGLIGLGLWSLISRLVRFSKRPKKMHFTKH